MRVEIRARDILAVPPILNISQNREKITRKPV
jgi:hypothetical protein